MEQSNRRSGFWEDYLSLDYTEFGEEDDDASEPAWRSDNGEGVERMLDAIDNTENYYERRAKAAREFVRRNAPRLLPVLNLILKNGSNRKESIWSMLKKRRRGNALRRPISKRGKRFLGSSVVAKSKGSFDTVQKK